MTDAELDRLDAFLAEKVMGWPLKAHNPFQPDRMLARRDDGTLFAPTRSAADAEEVREKWLSAPEHSLVTNGASEFWRAYCIIWKNGVSWNQPGVEVMPLRLAEMLAIARACGWEVQ